MMIDKNEIAKKMLKVTSSIAGSKNRHDSLLKATTIRLKTKGQNREELCSYLDNRLGKDEGIIISSNLYKTFTLNDPIEGEMLALENSLQKQNLSLACIYQRLSENELPKAVFIIIHRNLMSCIEYKDQINEIFGVREQKPLAELTKTFIKVTESLPKDINLAALVQACSLLENDEVYCISMNVFTIYQINPNHATQFLHTSGLVVCPLLKEIDPDVPQKYKEFEKIVGLLVSKTQVGIDWGLAHITEVLKVCNTSDAALLESKINAALEDKPTENMQDLKTLH